MVLGGAGGSSGSSGGAGAGTGAAQRGQAVSPPPARDAAIDTVRAALAEVHAVAERRHRGGEGVFGVVEGFSNGIDAILGRLFAEFLAADHEHVALVAVGGYGRRELCPRSDVDLLFLREKDKAGKSIERLIQLLWDSGFQLGHAVRTLKESYQYMVEDDSTATAVLEARFLAGSEDLFDRHEALCINRFRRRRARAFARTKLEILRRSIEDPGRTIYVIEPHLKDGVCGLRDIQTVRWIQNIRRRGGTLDALYEDERFSADEIRRVQEAYAFHLRVRCELHFTNGVRQDILERDSQLAVARNLGYGEGESDRVAVERLMGDYYRHARHVYRFLRFYLETGTRGRRFTGRLLRRLRARKVNPFLCVYKGRLYFQRDPLAEDPLADDPLAGAPERPRAERILEVFEVAQREGVRLSEVVCEWIRRQVGDMEEDMAHASAVLRSLVKILRDGRQAGRLLKTMHETGVLRRVLPEFSGLDCLVSFDGHHQFTVDEHTFRTLEELDRIEADAGYPEEEFRRVLLEIEDRLPLRVALLVHDIGKAIPGSHSVSSTEAALVISERLGLDPKVAETVEFLVYRHLELFTVSERRAFDDQVIETLARIVESEERLKMLYLLTYIDVHSVGPGTWTRWKGSQLSDLYQRTSIRLRTGSVSEDSLETALASARLEDADRQRIVAHCRKLDTPGYDREVVPERMLFHVNLIDAFLEKSEMQVAAEAFVGCHEITFCGRDRPRLFSDFAGLLVSEGFNILGARIYSRSDGVALDLFQVEVADTVQVGVEERVARLGEKLRKLERGEAAVVDFLRARARSYRFGRWRRPLFGPSVAVDNHTSARYTLVDVSAGDRPGLLYDLAVGLSGLGLNVRTAKVSTLADRAHDVFYVLGPDGRKVYDPAEASRIQEELTRQAGRSPGESW